MKQRVVIWCIAVVFSVLVVGSAFASVSYFVGQANQTSQRRYDNCISRRNLYDGQFVMVHFLARQFHASPAQETAAVKALRSTVHARPVCTH